MNDKQLIAQLQELKQIKPRQDWVISLKKEIVGEQPKFSSPAFAKASVGGQILTIFEVLPKLLFQRKLAYAFAFCLVALIGMFGFAQNTVPGDLLFPVKRIAEMSQTVLMAQKDQPTYNSEIANKRLEELVQVVKTKKVKNIGPAVKEFQASLAVLSGDEEAKELNKLDSLVQAEIEALEKSTLTEDQQDVLVEIKEACDRASYSEALEKILTITK